MNKVCFVFPGYKSQFVGMGKEFYDRSRIVQEYFEEASNCLNTNFVKLCFASSETELSRPEHAYTALFLVSSSIARVLKEEGIVPDAVVGFGLGDFAALNAGSSISIPDGLYLLSKYAHLYQEFLNGSELRIIQVTGVSREELQKIVSLCKYAKDIHFSAHITSTMHRFVGSNEALEEFEIKLSKVANCQITDKPLEGGPYMAAMHDIVKQLEMYTKKIDIKHMSIPLLTSDGLLVEEHAVNSYVIGQLERSIDFMSIIPTIAEYDIIVQIGPGSALRDILAQELPSKKIVSINNYNDIQQLQQKIGT